MPGFLDRIPGLVLIIVSGILMTSAFPPLPLGFLAYFALVPLIIAFVKDDFHLGLEKGFVFGFILNLGILFWLALNKGTQWYWAALSMVSAVLFLSLNYALIGLLIGIIGKRMGRMAGICSFPFVWTAVEYIRSFGALGFTWNNLCYTQSHAIQLIQIASLIGSSGVSFWIVLINVLIFQFISGNVRRNRLTLWLTTIFILFLFPEIYGLIRLNRPEETQDRRKVHVGLVQPNVDPTQKWEMNSFEDNMKLLHDLTDSVAMEQLDLVVWPETATPTFLRQNRRGALRNIIAHITRLDVSLLSGTPDYEWINDEDYKVYNSTFLLQPNSFDIKNYRKIRLVPFGEYIPLSDLFPDLDNLNLGQGNFDAGDSVNIFQIPLKIDHHPAADSMLSFTTAVCYESTFPHIIREGAKKGSELLVIVSNDAWFGFTSAPFLHAEISRFRAIENGIPVVRSANTGISLILDSRGRELCRKDFGEKGWLSAVITQGSPSTLYVKIGDWVGMVCVAVSVLMILNCLLKKRAL